MMSVQQKLDQVDALKKKIDALGKLSDDILKKINYRFRLDWNYYSNSMEGNTLTIQETRSIMVGNITVHGKPIKDVLEMRGHDHAIQDIMKIGKGDLNISESRIKAMHRAIMHEENQEKAKDTGVWKKENNYILNTRGERYDFTPHDQVPEAMHELINWYSAEKEKMGKKDALHPALHAIEFHLRYLTIHPFYDGNGRTARMLLNLILIANGYPPIVIRTEDKEKYYQYLTDIQGYGGDKDLYYELMLDLLLKSLNMVYDTATGKDISQPDDLDKKIALLKQEVSSLKTDEAKIQKNPEVINEFVHASLFPLVRNIDLKLKEIKTMFNDYEITAFKDGTGRSFKDFATIDINEIINFTQNDKPKEISFAFWLKGFKKAGIKAFSEGFKITVHLKEWTYEIKNSYNNLSAEPWLYGHQLNDEEIREITNNCIEGLIDDIQERLGN
jgi:Fic family protein